MYRVLSLSLLLVLAAPKGLGALAIRLSSVAAGGATVSDAEQIIQQRRTSSNPGRIAGLEEYYRKEEALQAAQRSFGAAVAADQSAKKEALAAEGRFNWAKLVLKKCVTDSGGGVLAAQRRGCFQPYADARNSWKSKAQTWADKAHRRLRATNHWYNKMQAMPDGSPGVLTETSIASIRRIADSNESEAYFYNQRAQ